jgi:hypothetical protein
VPGTTGSTCTRPGCSRSARPADPRALRPLGGAATGYTSGLEPVVGHLGVLDDRGHPLVTGARTSPSAPGLRFVGVSNPLEGLLFQISLDARAAARAIGRDLRRSR